MARGLADERRADGDTYAHVEIDVQISRQMVGVLHTAGGNAKMWIWVERGRLGQLGEWSGGEGRGLDEQKCPIAGGGRNLGTAAVENNDGEAGDARKHCYADGYI